MKRQNHSLNHKALNRLSARALRANRTRNAFAILAVLLTTLLLTCVFSIGISFSKNLATMELRTKGTAAQLTFPQPTQEQMQKLRTLPYLRAVGTEIQIGTVHPSAGSSAAIHIVYMDETQWERHIKPCVSDLQGHLPQKENEIMLSSYALSLLGIGSPREGMEIKLSFSGAPEEPFLLRGWYTEYAATSDGTALLSEAYCEAHGLTAEEQGSALLSVKKGEEKNITPRLMQDVKPTQGQGFLGGAEASRQEVPIPAVIGIALLIVLIALSGYLLIANVLNLSVSHDIRFYGLLKALGAQETQIGSIVRRQALLLAAIGIPAGLAIGALACFGLVPFAMRIVSSGAGSSAFPAEVSFHPLIFLGAALFALLTVLLSCRRPAKIAGRVAPIEALRHLEKAPTGKRKKARRRRGGHRFRLARMAWRNVFRDRKRAALVFTSMSLGIVLFLSISSLMDALGGEQYFNAKYPYDFVCTVQNADLEAIDLATGEALAGVPSPGTLQKDEIQNILERIQKTDGVTHTDVIRSATCTFPFDEALWEPVLREAYLRAAAQPVEEASAPDGEPQLSSKADYEAFVRQIKTQEQCSLRVYSLSDAYLKQYNRMYAQPVDPDAFRRGEICLIGSGDYVAMRGEQLSLTGKSTGDSAQLTIGGIFSWQNGGPPISQVASARTGYLEGIYVSNSLMERFDPQAAVERICLAVRPEAEPAVKASLKAIASSVEQGAFSVESKSDARANQETLIRTMQVLGGGLSLLLFLIGLLNFINVMFTGVLTRRREFAVMESIGLTKRQLFSLLLWEGLIHVLVTCVISLAASAGIYALLSKTVSKMIPYASFAFPYLPALSIIAGLLAVCLSTAAVMYCYSSHDSVTQRLRETEE